MRQEYLQSIHDILYTTFAQSSPKCTPTEHYVTPFRRIDAMEPRYSEPDDFFHLSKK
jgi:hypothetical protein